MIAAGLRELHNKAINFGLLNPWAIRFDKSSAMYLDMVWPVNKHITKINIDVVDSRYAHYIGMLDIIKLLKFSRAVL